MEVLQHQDSNAEVLEKLLMEQFLFGHCETALE